LAPKFQKNQIKKKVRQNFKITQIFLEFVSWKTHHVGK